MLYKLEDEYKTAIENQERNMAKLREQESLFERLKEYKSAEDYFKLLNEYECNPRGIKNGLVLTNPLFCFMDEIDRKCGAIINQLIMGIDFLKRKKAGDNKIDNIIIRGILQDVNTNISYILKNIKKGYWGYKWDLLSEIRTILSSIYSVLFLKIHRVPLDYVYEEFDLVEKYFEKLQETHIKHIEMKEVFNEKLKKMPFERAIKGLFEKSWNIKMKSKEKKKEGEDVSYDFSYSPPKMPDDERQNSELVLLMLLAQAYYKILECTITMAGWCTAVDMELNHSYLWVVQSLTNLLKNAPGLQDFPEPFEPQLPDIFPSTIRDLDWERAGPDTEQFLSTVQQYVTAKNIYEPDKGSSGWAFIELFRPGIDTAIKQAIAYHERMQQYLQQTLGDSSKTGASNTAEPKTDHNNDIVFISYSHKDKRWLDDLLIHLKPYTRNGSVKEWSDKQIAPGSKFLPEIEDALACTKVAVLLVTPDFLASDFIHNFELTPLLKNAAKGGVRILWIPIRSCAYKKTDLKEYQAVCNPEKPLANMKAKRDEIWVTICEEIEKAVRSVNQGH